MHHHMGKTTQAAAVGVFVCGCCCAEQRVQTVLASQLQLCCGKCFETIMLTSDTSVLASVRGCQLRSGLNGQQLEDRTAGNKDSQEGRSRLMMDGELTNHTTHAPLLGAGQHRRLECLLQRLWAAVCLYNHIQAALAGSRPLLHHGVGVAPGRQ